MTYYQSQEWMEETDQLPSRYEIYEDYCCEILIELDEYNFSIENHFNKKSDTDINEHLVYLYLKFLDYIDLGIIEIEIQDIFRILIFSIMDNTKLSQNKTIEILDKYISYGFIIEKLVDNKENKNNIIIQFANNQKYKVVDYLLTMYPHKLKSIQNVQTSDEESINLIINKLKKHTENIINEKFFKNDYKDVLNLIIEFNFNYFGN
jgi:hypothetical protein